MSTTALDAGTLRRAGRRDRCPFKAFMHLVAVVGNLQEGPSGQRLMTVLKEHDIPLEQCRTFTPHRKASDGSPPPRGKLDRVVPIHTFGGNAYGDVHPNAEIQPDGAW